MISVPFLFKNGSVSSNATGSLPSALEKTRSNCSRSSGRCAATSDRWAITCILFNDKDLQNISRNPHVLLSESSRLTCQLVTALPIGIPGTPLPLPTSITRNGLSCSAFGRSEISFNASRTCRSQNSTGSRVAVSPKDRGAAMTAFTYFCSSSFWERGEGGIKMQCNYSHFVLGL